MTVPTYLMTPEAVVEHYDRMFYMRTGTTTQINVVDLLAMSNRLSAVEFHRYVECSRIVRAQRLQGKP